MTDVATLTEKRLAKTNGDAREARRIAEGG